MELGLSKEIVNSIKDIVNKYEYKFKIFGSRARGDFKKTSDIDIAIFEDVTEEDEYNIRNDFDLLDMEYTVDLVFISKNTKIELLENIIREGIEI